MPGVSLLLLWTLYGYVVESCSHFRNQVKFWELHYFIIVLAVVLYLIYELLSRCVGVFKPNKLKSKRIRLYTKLIIALAWMLAYVPMLPGLFRAFGFYGLECKTRKCTVINMDYGTETPTSVNPKKSLGANTVVMSGLCLVVLNGLIYYRLWVWSLL